MIKSVLNKKVPAGQIPTQIGVLVLNIETVMEIAEICVDITQGEKKFMTVANLKDGTAVVVKVQNGQNDEAVLNAVLSVQGEKVYIGGGSNFCHEMKSGDRIVDTTSFLAIGELPAYEDAGNCKGCGRCSQSCPAGVEIS